MVADSARPLDGDTHDERTSRGEAMTMGRVVVCHCFEDLANMARPLIRRYRLQAEVAEEDVANTVLYDLCMATAAGKTPELEPGGDSRKFARVLLVRAVLHARSRARSIRRGGSGRDRAPAGGDGSPSSGSSLHRVALDLDGLQATGPAVEDLVNASMEAEYLTERLDDPALKQIATMLLQGFTAREIARETKQGHATVSRKILQIQTIWRESALES